ncbi:MAG: SDR family oxidoreductase [Henriciella sp.]
MSTDTSVQSAPFSLAGRHAFVTGSSRGIGKAIALGMAAAGAKVSVHGQRHSAELEDLCLALDASHQLGKCVVFDLSDEDSFGAEVITQLGQVDILVLNASQEVREPLFEIKAQRVRDQFETNFLSSILLCQKFLPGMLETGWGRIIGLGSIQERHANPSLAPYAALKAAQTHYLQMLALEVASQGVTVNTLAPGAIETDRNREVLAVPETRRAVTARIPAGRIGDVEDCVGAAVFLASDAAAYVTGAWVPVDGGFHAI